MQLVSLAKNPVPSGAVVGTFAGYDGAPLRFARWEATRGPRRGTACLFGGRGEFIEKYFEVIADLRRRGFAVAAMDWRGQGGSHRALRNRSKGYVGDFAEHDRDLFRFMRNVVLPDCPPPYIALAHSTGANVLLRNSVMPGSWFDRMILTAPLLAIDEQHLRYTPTLVRPACEILRWTGLSSLYVPGGDDTPAEAAPYEGNLLTSDHERWARNKAVLDAAPQLGTGSATLAWLRAALRSCALLAHPDFARNVRVPMLIFSAGDDRIVSTRAIEEFSVRLKVGAHVLLPFSRHEILQESDPIRQKFWVAFDAYLGSSSVAA